MTEEAPQPDPRTQRGYLNTLTSPDLEAKFQALSARLHPEDIAIELKLPIAELIRARENSPVVAHFWGQALEHKKRADLARRRKKDPNKITPHQARDELLNHLWTAGMPRKYARLLDDSRVKECQVAVDALKKKIEIQGESDALKQQLYDLKVELRRETAIFQENVKHVSSRAVALMPKNSEIKTQRVPATEEDLEGLPTEALLSALESRRQDERDKLAGVLDEVRKAAELRRSRLKPPEPTDVDFKMEQA